MNIQIFGKKKCFATSSAERFFKERKIKYQFINLAEKGMSLKELESVLNKIKDIDLLFDKKSNLYLTKNIAKLRTLEAKKEVILNCPMALNTPIVRDCDTKECTIGQQESVWKLWIK